MRAISTAAAAVLQGRVVPMAVLVDMDLSMPLRVSTWHRPLTWDGATYLGAGELGQVDATDEMLMFIARGFEARLAVLEAA